MILPLEELVRRAKACPHSISYEQRFELCSACNMIECKPKSAACLCRARRAEMEKARYDKNPKMQQRNRKHRYTPEQWAKRLADERKSRHGLEFKIKRAEYMEQNREKILAQRRKRHAERQQELQA